MPFRTALRRAAVATATAALALLPGLAASAQAAQAATPPAAPIGLALHAVDQGRLLPGGGSRSFEFSVTNRTAGALPVDGSLRFTPTGAMPLFQEDVRQTLTSVHAPAAWLSPVDGFGAADGGFGDQLLPAGAVDGGFTIPAHTTWTWKLTLAATRHWLINDRGFTLRVAAWTDPHQVQRAWLHYRVGTAATGGPIVESLTGSTAIGAHQRGFYTFSITNRTGAAVTWDRIGPWIGEVLNQKIPFGAISLRFELWQGGRWTPLDPNWTALPFPHRLADGATVSYHVRATLTGWTLSGSSAKLLFGAQMNSWYAPLAKWVKVTR